MASDPEEHPDTDRLFSIDNRFTRCCVSFVPITLLAGCLIVIFAKNLIDALETKQVNSPAAPVVATQLSPSSDLQLAFLNQGDVFLMDITQEFLSYDGWLEKGLPKPQQLTHGWDAVSFAWSPDGQLIAGFNGHLVHILNLGTNPPFAKAIDLPLTQATSTIPMITWTPDQRHVVVWNVQNPSIGLEVGWFFINTDGSDPPKEPRKGRVKNILSLADGGLVGIVEEACGLEECPLDLYYYNPDSKQISMLNLEEFNQSGGVGVLNTSLTQLLRNGPEHIECGYYSDAHESITLSLRSRSGQLSAKEMPLDFFLAPDGKSVLITRGVACNEQIQADWADSCWPGGGPGDYTMYLWDESSSAQAVKENELVSGVFTDWSPNSQWIGFQSCLAVTPPGERVAVDVDPPWIFVMERSGEKSTIRPVSEGHFPSWRPMPP